MIGAGFLDRLAAAFAADPVAYVGLLIAGAIALYALGEWLAQGVRLHNMSARKLVAAKERPARASAMRAWFVIAMLFGLASLVLFFGALGAFHRVAAGA